MFFAVSTKWAPVYGLAFTVVGAIMVYFNINEGHEVIGGGLMMATLSLKHGSTEK